MDFDLALMNAMELYQPGGLMPFWDRMVTLVVVRNGIFMATKKVDGKKEIIAKAVETDTLMIAWTGKYSTNIFSISLRELKGIPLD